MIRLSVRYLVVFCLSVMTACGPANVQDLSLDSTRRSIASENWIDAFGSRPTAPIAFVALVSTRDDLREIVGPDGWEIDTLLAPCLEGQENRWGSTGRERLSTRLIWDEVGDIRDWTLRSASPGARRVYRLPVSWRSTRYEGRADEDEIEAERADQELRDGTADLCLTMAAFGFFGEVWRTNTVVIPRAAIRAALDAPRP